MGLQSLPRYDDRRMAAYTCARSVDALFVRKGGR